MEYHGHFSGCSASRPWLALALDRMAVDQNRIAFMQPNLCLCFDLCLLDSTFLRCDLPMAVWRSHCMRISVQDNLDMEAALLKVAHNLRPDKEYFADKMQRTIFTHLHWHARDVKSAPWRKFMRKPKQSISATKQKTSNSAAPVPQAKL